MGANGGSRRLRGAAAPRNPSLPSLDRLALPALALGYAGSFGALLFALEQIVVAQAEGPWVELAGAGALGLAALTAGRLAVTAVRRLREGLTRRAAAWGAAAVGAALLGALAAFVLVVAAQVGPIITGADVHLTRPVMRSLPRPPQAVALRELPGPAGTESLSQDFRISDLSGLAPFYREALGQAGWKEDASRGGSSLLRFTRAEFTVTVLVDLPQDGAATGPGEFTVIVDRGASPSLSPTR